MRVKEGAQALGVSDKSLRRAIARMVEAGREPPPKIPGQFGPEYDLSPAYVDAIRREIADTQAGGAEANRAHREEQVALEAILARYTSTPGRTAIRLMRMLSEGATTRQTVERIIRVAPQLTVRGERRRLLAVFYLVRYRTANLVLLASTDAVSEATVLRHMRRLATAAAVETARQVVTGNRPGSQER